MAFDKNSGSFTFIFATVMVVVTAVLLAVAAIQLKPFQDDNVRKEKMQNILASIRIRVGAEEAEEKFNTIVKRQVVLDHTGATLEGQSAFEVDVQKQYKEWKAGARTIEELSFPLYECEMEGKTYYVVPMVGAGLWGPIWGYITLESDMNTIYGANFDHKGETPGLGAEIRYEPFQNAFIGKKIFDEAGAYQSIKIVKSGAAQGDWHSVDGITGGTITSNGVGEMLYRSLKVYIPFFESQKGEPTAVEEPMVSQPDSLVVDSSSTQTQSI